MEDCKCGKTQESLDRQRFRQIAATLPLTRGTIIKEDGTTVDISDILDIPVSKADPQLAKAQSIFPYIRDLTILEDGRTCSLIAWLEAFNKKLEDSLLQTDETRFTRVSLSDSDWDE